MKKNYFHSEKDDEPEPVWPVIRDRLDILIGPAKNWHTAQVIAEIPEMAKHFTQAYPEILFCYEDLRLALHDLGIPYERNEHNNKYYYLANWK